MKFEKKYKYRKPIQRENGTIVVLIITQIGQALLKDSLEKFTFCEAAALIEELIGKMTKCQKLRRFGKRALQHLSRDQGHEERNKIMQKLYFATVNHPAWDMRRLWPVNVERSADRGHIAFYEHAWRTVDEELRKKFQRRPLRYGASLDELEP